MEVDESLIRYGGVDEGCAQQCLDELMERECDALIVCQELPGLRGHRLRPPAQHPPGAGHRPCELCGLRLQPQPALRRPDGLHHPAGRGPGHRRGGADPPAGGGCRTPPSSRRSSPPPTAPTAPPAPGPRPRDKQTKEAAANPAAAVPLSVGKTRGESPRETRSECVYDRSFPLQYLRL